MQIGHRVLRVHNISFQKGLRVSILLGFFCFLIVRILFAYNTCEVSCMLRDIERKVLAILRNFSALQKRMPSFRELSKKTGKHENEIRYILNKLQEAGYIEWDGHYTQSIAIIKGWVDPPPSKNNTFIGKN